MTEPVPSHPDIERVIWLTVDCLRWDYHEPYRDLYPPGVWYRGVPQSTFTPISHTSAFTGLNPYRHGVLDIGEVTPRDSVFDATDSIAFSKIIQNWGMFTDDTVESRAVHIPFEHLLECRVSDEEHFHSPPMTDRDYTAIANHDLAFLHDWILHGTGWSHEEWDWTETVYYDESPVENHARYDRHVELSRDAHRDFLDELKARGLYENTLFIVWGDHGQALNENPFEELLHRHFPEDEVARVPIAFCSTLFEETAIDTATNVRSVDIVPTLRTVCETADIPWETPIHETEGVDLTSFEGSLVGHSVSDATHSTGAMDGVKTANHSLISTESGSVVMESELPADVDVTSEPVQRQTFGDDDALRAQLERYYSAVRDGPTQLIYHEETA